VATDLFDQDLRALRRARALRRGPELFLHERAFEDIVERLAFVQRRFSSVLLIGSLDPGWRDRLLRSSDRVTVVEPQDLMSLEPGAYDLCVAVGELDTAADLPQALLTVRFALREDSLFIGALPGGDSLPALRSAMRAADEAMGAATPHAHPRIEPAGLTSLLNSAGFTMPVVDVDRVQVSYRSLQDLVRDLRSMDATNVLKARSRTPLTRAASKAAEAAFMAGAEDGRVTETFELLHFAAWTPHARPHG
jgi:NADH dehydrogenase [ubiquinone] 1 alpha subcomplex assembly factor 5